MDEARPLKGIPQEFAAKLEAARASRVMQGERRVVTILFCDVSGSTVMAEQLDPEEWAEIMGNAFDYLIAPVYRYEGTVARLMGDAILAFFGAPITHEDDPQRAVLAGLDIVAGIQPFREKITREYGLDFNVRVGINTGPVVVGEIGFDLAMEYTAMGDAANLAARMEQTAQPGTVQVAEETYRLVAPLFDFEPLEGIRVKGKKSLVQAYRVLGRKEQPGSLRGIAGLTSPLVGRAREFDALRQSMNELSQGRGQIVWLVGEAGLGKSRLIREVRAEWEKTCGQEGWIESRGISYDTARPYGLFQQHLRQVCGVKENDPPELISQKIAEGMKTLPVEQGELIDRAVDMLLVTRTDPGSDQLQGEAFKKELFDILLNLWRNFARQTPLVMVFDDLHWADPASVELLLYIFQLTDEVPILFLCAFRPYRHSPGWRVKQAAETDYPHRYVEITLVALSDEDSETLVATLLKISDLPQQLRQLILRKAEGNPFFVEEVVRTLIESGAVVRDESGTRWRATTQVEEIAIPDTLQALLISRMDRLEAEVRRTLQLASVIGRSFSLRVLKEISEANGTLERHLNSLQRVELIREAARVPELEYSFLHELTRDAAYHTILHRQRREFHRRVGEAIQALYPDRLEEEAHRLAHHFAEARDYPRALKYYTLAGDMAARLYANVEAIGHYGRALEFTRLLERRGEATSEQQVYLYTRHGRILEFCGQYDEALALYQELEELALRRGDLSMELAALIPQATIYSVPTVKINAEKGRALAERALELASELSDHRAETRALWSLMLLDNFTTKDLQRAVNYGERALEIARQHNLREELAFILNDIARPYLALGRTNQVWASLGESQTLWRELNNLPMLADNLGTAGEAYYLAGEFDHAIEVGSEALRISRTIGSAWGQAYSLTGLGLAYLERGEIDLGLQALDESLPLAEEANFAGGLVFVPMIREWVFSMLGYNKGGIDTLSSLLNTVGNMGGEFAVYLLTIEAQQQLSGGEVKKAAQTIKKFKEQYPIEGLDVYFGPFIVNLICEVALSNQEYEEALEVAERAIALFYASKVRLSLPDLLHNKARAMLSLGRSEEGSRVLQQALEEARQQVSRRSLWQILYSLMRYETEVGNLDKAERLRQDGREVIEFMTAHMGQTEDELGELQKLRNSFLNLPRVREMMRN